MSVTIPGISVKSLIDAKTMKSDINFSDNDIDSALNEQASLFAHYGEIHADSQYQADTVKLMLDNAEAAVYQAIRDDMDMKGERVTEAMLEKMVSRHPKVVEMKKAYNQAKRIVATSKIAVEAFRHRRDMLIQKGMIRREEMKGELRINGPSIRESADQDQRNRILQRR